MKVIEKLRVALRNTRRGWHLPLIGVCLVLVGLAPIVSIFANSPDAWWSGLPFLIFIYGGFIALKVYFQDLFNPASKSGFASTLARYQRKFQEEGLSPIDAVLLAEEFARADHDLPTTRTLPTPEQRTVLADFYQATKNQPKTETKTESVNHDANRR